MALDVAEDSPVDPQLENGWVSLFLPDYGFPSSLSCFFFSQWFEVVGPFIDGSFDLVVIFCWGLMVRTACLM